MKSVFVIGSGSRIAREFALLAALDGWSVVLGGRDMKQTGVTARDIAVRSGATNVTPALLDLEQEQTVDDCIGRHISKGGLDGVFVASGIMPSESSMASSPALFAKMAEVNYVGVVALLEKLLPCLAPGEGTFASCLTSVAGDRGRGSNFRYGSTKAALSTYLEGLSVSRSGQTLVQDVKLGPVDTPMNSGVRRAPFMISPDAAAGAIWRGIRRGKPKLYVPAKWFWIMLAIRTIPAPIYRLLPL